MVVKCKMLNVVNINVNIFAFKKSILNMLFCCLALLILNILFSNSYEFVKQIGNVGNSGPADWSLKFIGNRS